MKSIWSHSTFAKRKNQDGLDDTFADPPPLEDLQSTTSDPSENSDDQAPVNLPADPAPSGTDQSNSAPTPVQSEEDTVPQFDDNTGKLVQESPSGNDEEPAETIDASQVQAESDLIDITANRDTPMLYQGVEAENINNLFASNSDADPVSDQLADNDENNIVEFGGDSKPDSPKPASEAVALDDESSAADVAMDEEPSEQIAAAEPDNPSANETIDSGENLAEPSPVPGETEADALAQNAEMESPAPDSSPTELDAADPDTPESAQQPELIANVTEPGSADSNLDPDMVPAADNQQETFTDSSASDLETNPVANREPGSSSVIERSSQPDVQQQNPEQPPTEITPDPPNPFQDEPDRPMEGDSESSPEQTSDPIADSEPAPEGSDENPFSDGDSAANETPFATEPGESGENDQPVAKQDSNDPGPDTTDASQDKSQDAPAETPENPSTTDSNPFDDPPTDEPGSDAPDGSNPAQENVDPQEMADDPQDKPMDESNPAEDATDPFADDEVDSTDPFADDQVDDAGIGDADDANANDGEAASSDVDRELANVVPTGDLDGEPITLTSEPPPAPMSNDAAFNYLDYWWIVIPIVAVVVLPLLFLFGRKRDDRRENMPDVNSDKSRWKKASFDSQAILEDDQPLSGDVIDDGLSLPANASAAMAEDAVDVEHEFVSAIAPEAAQNAGRTLEMEPAFAQEVEAGVPVTQGSGDVETDDSFFDELDLEDEPGQPSTITAEEHSLETEDSAVALQTEIETPADSDAAIDIQLDSDEFDFSADSDFSDEDLPIGEETDGKLESDLEIPGDDERGLEITVSELASSPAQSPEFLQASPPSNDLAASLVNAENNNGVSPGDLIDDEMESGLLDLDESGQLSFETDEEIELDHPVQPADAPSGMQREESFELTASKSADFGLDEFSDAELESADLSDKTPVTSAAAKANLAISQALDHAERDSANELAMLHQQVALLQDSNKQFATQLDAAVEEKAALEEQLQNSENKILELSGTLDAASQEKMAMTERARSNEIRVTELSEEVAQSDQERSDLKQQLEAAAERIQQLETRSDEIGHLEQRLEQMQSEFEHAINEKDSLLAELNEKEAQANEFEAMKSRLKQLQQDFESSINEKKDLADRLARTESSLKAMEQDSADRFELSPAVESKKRQTKVDPKTGKVKISRRDEGALKMLEALKKENRKRKQNELLLEQAEEHRAELMAEMRVLREREDDLLEIHSKLTSAAHVDSVEEVVKKLEASDDRVSELEAAVQKLEAERNQQRSQFKELVSEMIQLRSDSGMAANLESRLADLERDLADNESDSGDTDKIGK